MNGMQKKRWAVGLGLAGALMLLVASESRADVRFRGHWHRGGQVTASRSPYRAGFSHRPVVTSDSGRRGGFHRAPVITVTLPNGLRITGTPGQIREFRMRMMQQRMAQRSRYSHGSRSRAGGRGRH